MSKENISVNDILEEFSPDSHKVDKKDTNNSNSTPTDTPLETPKTLEQLELERLEAISQGELSDTTINYSSYANKPNKVIENPKQSKKSNDTPTKGVLKISSRPEFKEKLDVDKKEVSNNVDDSTSTETDNEPIKIDSRNDKAKLESTNNKRKNYSRSHNEISDEDFSSMAEKLQRAKAKRQLQIDELNSKYQPHTPEVNQTLESNPEPPTATPSEEETHNQPIENKKKFSFPKKKAKEPTTENLTEKSEEVSQVIPTDGNQPIENNKKFSFPKKKAKEPTTENLTEKSEEVSQVIPTDGNQPIENKKKFSFPKKKAKEPTTENLTEKSEEVSQVIPTNDNKPTESISKDAPETTEPTVKVKKAKKSIFQKIVDYYTYTVDENGEAIPPEEDTITETITESEPLDVEPLEDVPETLETPKPKQKESFKEFITTLFTSKEKPAPPKKETFKERMVEFFSVQDEESSETAQPVEESIPTTKPVEESIPTVKPVEESIPMAEPVEESIPMAEPVEESIPTVKPVEKVVPTAKPVEESTPTVEPVKESVPTAETVKETIPTAKPVEESIPTAEPVKESIPTVKPVVETIPTVEPVEENIPTAKPVEEAVPTVEPVKESIPTAKPVEESIPTAETVKESVPTAEEVAHVEEIVNDLLADNPETDSENAPKPNLFRRIKNYFLMDEVKELDIDKDEEEENILEEEATPVDEPVETPVKSLENEETSPTENEKTEDSKEDYILPFNEDTPEEDIDIPIEEGVKYKHFWQDPDFNPIDRFKTYVEDTSEKYRNRKRSGEIHIEIKSNPDTAILFSDLKDKVLAEEELIKSREEFKKQVENGEYDNYDENSKGVDSQAEPTFKSTSINDFNAYQDKPRIQEQISEMKTGTFVRKTIIGVLCVLSTYIALANDLDLPTVSALNVETSASGYLMVQFVCGLVAILTCIKSVISGIVKIFKGNADSDSFSAVGIVSAFVASLVTFLMAKQVTDTQMLNIYMPVALLGMFFNLTGKSYIVKREQSNFRYISKDKPKHGMFCIQDDYDAEKITKGLVDDYPVTAYTRKTNFTSDFVKYTYSYDMADKFSKFAVPIICVASIVVALVSAIVYNQSFDMVFPVGFFSILSMLISFCSCFSIPVYINSMLYHVSRKYAKREGAILGYQAVEDFYDTNSLIVNAKDIFPKGSINISALKLFSNAKVDETLIYAISLANKVDSILAPTLLEILDGNLDMLCDVENCSYENGLGICGWIDNKRVLMGNRELMETHNIENLPSRSKEMELVGSKRDCIYISISGNLSLMLIVDIIPNHKVAQDLQAIQKHGIGLAISSCDFLVSINKLCYLFDIDGENVKVIPPDVFEETREYFTDKDKCSTSIVTNGDIGMMVNLLLATKKIHAKAIVGNILSAVSCILGVVIGISFISMGGFRELTSSMVLVYNLICTGITMLICNSKKF